MDRMKKAILAALLVCSSLTGIVMAYDFYYDNDQQRYVFLNTDLELNGGLALNTTALSRPDCNFLNRGMIWFKQGALGVADRLQVCGKTVLDIYAWTNVAIVV